MKKKLEGQYVKVIARVTPSQDKALKDLAKKEGLSVSAIIRNLIATHIA